MFCLFHSYLGGVYEAFTKVAIDLLDRWTNPLNIKEAALDVFGVYVPICLLEALFNSQIVYFKHTKMYAMLLAGPIYGKLCSCGVLYTNTFDNHVFLYLKTSIPTTY